MSTIIDSAKETANSVGDSLSQIDPQLKRLAAGILAGAAVGGGAGGFYSAKSKPSSATETPAQRRRRILRDAMITASLGAGAAGLGVAGYNSFSTALPANDVSPTTDLLTSAPARGAMAGAGILAMHRGGEGRRADAARTLSGLTSDVISERLGKTQGDLSGVEARIKELTDQINQVPSHMSQPSALTAQLKELETQRGKFQKRLANPTLSKLQERLVGTDQSRSMSDLENLFVNVRHNKSSPDYKTLEMLREELSSKLGGGSQGKQSLDALLREAGMAVGDESNMSRRLRNTKHRFLGGHNPGTNRRALSNLSRTAIGSSALLTPEVLSLLFSGKLPTPSVFRAGPEDY